MNKKYENELFCDFQVSDFSDWKNNQLIIVGSDDFCYYHQVEIIFKNVKYFSGVFEWRTTPNKYGIMELMNEKSRQSLVEKNRIPDLANGVMFINDDKVEIMVIAEEILISFGTVFYYFRENMKAGERMAEWVKRD